MHHQPIAAGKSSFELIDRAALFKELALETAAVFLDAACGRGAYSLAASSRMGEDGLIYSVDLWEDGIAELSQAIRTEGITNIRAIQADISRHIPVDTGTVSVCLMATVLHDLIQDRTDAGTLREIERVLSPDGRLALVEFQKIGPPPGPPRSIRLSPDEADAVLAPFGFQRKKSLAAGSALYLSIYSCREKSAA